MQVNNSSKKACVVPLPQCKLLPSSMATYAENSIVQRKVLLMARPVRESAMKTLYTSLFPVKGTAVGIADLGCCIGPNALLVAGEFIATVDRIRRDSSHHDWLPEFQVFLNDLPENDFNSIFGALTGFRQQLNSELGPEFGSCFVTGVPGSFYGRLFPSHSLHFVHSSNTLHWLSQVPKGIEKSKGRSRESIGEAYSEQFRHDFSSFLRCRSEELVTGGCMVFTIHIRQSKYPPHHEHCFSSAWVYLEKALSQMASEGLVDEEKLDIFNQPFYAPSMAEIEDVVKEEGSFTINFTDTFELSNLDAVKDADGVTDDQIHYYIRSFRNGAEPILLSHFGQDLSVDDVFRRYEKIVREFLTNEIAMIHFASFSLKKAS